MVDSYTVPARTRSVATDAPSTTYNVADRGRDDVETLAFLRLDSAGMLVLSLDGPADAWMYEDSADSLSLTEDATGEDTATLVVTGSLVEITD